MGVLSTYIPFAVETGVLLGIAEADMAGLKYVKMPVGKSHISTYK